MRAMCSITRAQAIGRYEELMQKGLAYFTTQNPTEQLDAALNRSTTEISHLICVLVARYVLACDLTGFGRRRRLSSMGFF
jgi:hypothetical protein